MNKKPVNKFAMRSAIAGVVGLILELILFRSAGSIIEIFDILLVSMALLGILAITFGVISIIQIMRSKEEHVGLRYAIFGVALGILLPLLAFLSLGAALS